MKFEDLTKEELVYILRENEWKLHGVDFKGTLRRFRAQNEEEKITVALEKSEKATCAYLKWLSDHNGMKLVDIPMSEIEEGARLERAVKQCSATYEKLTKKRYGE